ncbi:MAG TPA: oligosaccharide flippase family protein [Planctomycetota bacterium]|nr:oligosaccharide flippase family protein [Planctomycetota bacterium]
MSDDAALAVPEPAAKPSLRSLALRGAVWTLAGDGGSQLLRFISNLVLTRLLVPDAFGIMLIISVVQQGLSMFSDVGIHPAIVQHKRGDDPTFLDTAWTIQAFRGVGLWLVTCLIAWPAVLYSKQPALLYLLPVAGLSTITDGLLSTKFIVLDRHLSLGKLTLLSFGSAAFSLAVKIAWAWASPTVWALIAGGLSQSLFRTVLSHAILPGAANRFRWDKECARELMSFGRWIFMSTLLTFIAMQLDKILFVKYIPLAMLGIYYNGSTICRIPADTVQRIMAGVAFPAFSRLKDRQGDFSSAYRRIRAPLLVGSGAIFAALTLGGPLVALILYPAIYQDAGWIIQIIAVSCWFQALEYTNVTTLLAFGQPKWMAAGNFVKIVAMAGVLPLAFHYWGFPGALVGMALVEVPKYLFEAWQVRRNGLSGWGVELATTGAVLASAACAFHLHVRAAWDQPRTKFLVAGACFALIWTPFLLWARKVVKQDVAATLRTEGAGAS